MARLLKPTAHEAADKLIEILSSPAKQGFAKTITADNGLQFAQHERVTSELGATMYFARPYHP